MLPNVEMVRVEVLDNAVEEYLGDTVDLYHPESVLPLLLQVLIRCLSESAFSVEHRLEVVTASSKHHRVAFDEKLILEVEDNIEELVQVHAEFHRLNSVCLFGFLLLLRGLYR